MRKLDVEPSSGKVAAARLVELLGRLKPNGRLRGRTPLAPLIELEALLVGIRGKRALWVALRAADLRALDDVPIGNLARDAQAQEAAVEELRVAAARRALAEGPMPARDPTSTSV